MQQVSTSFHASRRGFSLCIPAGSVVSALSALSPSAVDWSKVHVFFTGERLGVNKSYTAALDAFCRNCKIQNVFYPIMRCLGEQDSFQSHLIKNP